MKIDAHDDNPKRQAEQALGGRRNGGDECPDEAVLLLAASSGYTPPALKEHLGGCAVCQRIYELASEPVDELEASKLQSIANLVAALDDLRAPVIKRFQRGSVRVIVGRRMLLLLLEPHQFLNSWTQSCWLDSKDRQYIWRPNLSSSKIIPWSRGESIVLQIETEQGSDEMTFQRDEWDDKIRFLGVAVYPGTIEQAKALLESLEKSRPEVEALPGFIIDALTGHGRVARDAFEQLELFVKPALNQAHSPSNDVESKCLDDALVETWKMAYGDKESLLNNPKKWLLEKARTNYVNILHSRLGTVTLLNKTAQEISEDEQPQSPPGQITDEGKKRASSVKVLQSSKDSGR